MLRHALLLSALLPMLDGCGKPQKPDEVSIDIADRYGHRSEEVRIVAPGFQGSVRIPGFRLGTSGLDMKGLKLYPGSNVGQVVVNAEGRTQALRVAFTSPADPVTVRRWFLAQAARSDLSLREDATGLSGSTADREPIRIDLVAADRATSGTLRIGS